jgi:hypothetical protein
MGMSVILQSGTLTQVLPTPQDGDTEACEATLKMHVSMTGLLRTYKRSGGYRRLSYTFNVPTASVWQIKIFLSQINGLWFTMHDYRNQNWKVMLSANPVVFTDYSRTKTSFTLEFLGVRI